MSRVSKYGVCVLLFLLVFSNVSVVFADAVELLESMSNVVHSVDVSSDAQSVESQIVHIEELHNAYGVQKNIVAILEGLRRYAAEQGRDFVVAIEGSPYGVIDTAPLQLTHTTGDAVPVFDALLKNGKIGAAEYMHALYDDFCFLGLENMKIYQRGKDLYLDSLQNSDSLFSSLDAIDRALTSLERDMYSPDLLRLKEKSNFLYVDTEKTNDLESVLELVRDMQRLAHKYEYALDERSQVILLSEVATVLEGIDINALEQDVVLFCQSADIECPDVDKQDSIFEFVMQYANDVKLTDLTMLKQYSSCVQQLSSLDYQTLMRSLRAYERELSYSLCFSNAQRQLIFFEYFLKYLKNLLSLQLSSIQEKEAVQYSVTTIQECLVFILKYLNVVVCSDDEVYALQIAYKQQQDFYGNALRRDRVLCENSLALRKEYPRAIFVVITGGFHSHNMCEGWTDNGVSYVSVRPRVDGVSVTKSRDAYHDALNGRMVPFVKTLYSALIRSGVAPQDLKALSESLSVQKVQMGEVYAS